MNSVTVQLLYVESTTDETPFAWYKGTVLTADQHAERAQIHREMNDIINGAIFDRSTEWGRVARHGDRLLVEVQLESTADAPDLLTATIVVSVSGTDTEWADDAAHEISALLGEHGFSMPAEQLTLAFVEGWSRKRPFPRVFAAVGAALLMVLWWIIRAARLRRRR
jgi:hypothetical protein